MPADDERWMEEALREAARAASAGEVPVGAVVVRDGEIVGRGHNRVVADRDPTAHAEIVALREAARSLGNYRLEACALFVTLEPCVMCAGAMVHARVHRLVFGALDPKAGAVESHLRVLDQTWLNHRVETAGGVLAARCGDLLQSFFHARRNAHADESTDR